jgi:ketosteroid isomerase-like protein
MSHESTTPDLAAAFQRGLDAIGRRDWDAAMTVYRPDAVWDMSAGGLGVFEGTDAIRGFFEDWWAAYEDFEQSLEQFRELHNGITLAVALARAHLRSAAGVIELRYATVTTWTGGLIERNTLYTDIPDAGVAAERLAGERPR